MNSHMVTWTNGIKGKEITDWTQTSGHVDGAMEPGDAWDPAGDIQTAMSLQGRK